jgi:formylglycine-generating enzyme required for sulfatase activity
MTKLAVITRTSKQIHYFTESLVANRVGLEMVLISGGRFLMGSSETEIGHQPTESPQHWVTVPTFFMGQTPVTQAQWEVVANMKPVDRDLSPTPSRFAGQNLPVEFISHDDAREFCARLSRHTNHSYRLPSEAEWEYACRAGSVTPFHFGETITTDLANYDGTDGLDDNWSGSYGAGPKGTYRQKTTPVKTFPANSYGLYDMHGNVWEWCLDDWHDNYENAPNTSGRAKPNDGSAWIDGNSSYKVMRGGSWYNNPRNCRSATRSFNYLDHFNIGFRVMCETPRT